MEKIKLWLQGFKRVSLELTIFGAIIIVFFGGFYEAISNPLQLILLKVVLISAGGLHAHYMGKLFLPKVNWNLRLSEQKGAYFARVGLYIILPICYSIGG